MSTGTVWIQAGSGVRTQREAGTTCEKGSPPSHGLVKPKTRELRRTSLSINANAAPRPNTRSWKSEGDGRESKSKSTDRPGKPAGSQTDVTRVTSTTQSMMSTHHRASRAEGRGGLLKAKTTDGRASNTYIRSLVMTSPCHYRTCNSGGLRELSSWCPSFVAPCCSSPGVFGVSPSASRLALWSPLFVSAYLSLSSCLTQHLRSCPCSCFIVPVFFFFLSPPSWRFFLVFHLLLLCCVALPCPCPGVLRGTSCLVSSC